MRYKSPRVRAAYNMFIFALIITLIVIGIVGVLTTQDANAEKAPTQNENHCLMLTSGICYIVYPANCVPGEPEIYGSESMGIPVVCEDKGE